ncbi:putative peptidase family-domain-containing protein [Aspergillus desertorum]
MTKRSIAPESALTSAPAKRGRRVQPTPVEKRPFRLTNITDGEVVHQTCLSLHGECQVFDYGHETNYVSILVSHMLTNASGNTNVPAQHWPLHKGHWKALAMLSPGQNTLTLSLHHASGIHDTMTITVTYIPLLQLPPLHLAVLVASDSPLLIDCPPAKYGAISTAHSTLDAAIAKLRMAAYMWQAFTAEDFRQKGLGRRSFRLDEEWGCDTTSIHGSREADGCVMRNIAKVHIIRTDKTVAQIRDAQVAQQNPRGRDRDALHRYFETALSASGPPFTASCRPVVAGMILDSHYSAEQSLILGHAALGCHKPDGISLGIFGSHLAYSWPRFLEEVPACLTDNMPTGDTVGNDNGECASMRAACFVGQGAFLHEVGHAFGAGHTSGIMARGYSTCWGMGFVEHKRNMITDNLAGHGRKANRTKNEAKWDLRDLLQFKLLPHFALPEDEPVQNQSEFRRAAVNIRPGLPADDYDSTNENKDGDEEGAEYLQVTCKAGLAQVTIQGGDNEPIISYTKAASGWKGDCTLFRINSDILNTFDRTRPLRVTALGMNGKERTVSDAWNVLKDKPYISIPGSKVVLRKQAVQSDGFGEKKNDDDEAFIPWAMLLYHRGKDGKLHRATSIDLRVGCTMDGAVVYYADGWHENCGPARDAGGRPHQFGGHASELHDLPEGESIAKVLICHEDDGWGSLAGIRMVLSNGEAWGHLNSGKVKGDEDLEQPESEGEGVTALEPGEDEVVVGFYGQSAKNSGFCYQFGILTAPKDVQLPEAAYDMLETSNASNHGTITRRGFLS